MEYLIKFRISYNLLVITNLCFKIRQAYLWRNYENSTSMKALTVIEISETNLMSLAFLFNYLILYMFRMLVLPSSGACDLFVELFQWSYCSGTMCVGVTLWFGCGGVVSGCRLKPVRLILCLLERASY